MSPTSNISDLSPHYTFPYPLIPSSQKTPSHTVPSSPLKQFFALSNPSLSKPSVSQQSLPQPWRPPSLPKPPPRLQQDQLQNFPDLLSLLIVATQIQPQQLTDRIVIKLLRHPVERFNNFHSFSDPLNYNAPSYIHMIAILHQPELNSFLHLPYAYFRGN